MDPVKVKRKVVEEYPEDVDEDDVDEEAEPGILSRIYEEEKSETIEAGIRLEGSQLAKLTRVFTLKILKDRGAPDGVISWVSESLQSDVGLAVLKYMLGRALPLVPRFGKYSHVKRLCKEMRIQGKFDSADRVIDFVMALCEPFFDEVEQYLSKSETATTDAGIKVTAKLKRGKKVSFKPESVPVEVGVPSPFGS